MDHAPTSSRCDHPKTHEPDVGVSGSERVQQRSLVGLSDSLSHSKLSTYFIITYKSKLDLAPLS